MACSPYKLSCSLFGHTLDVRSIDVTPSGDILSGSRDKSSKLWSMDLSNNSYKEIQSYQAHENFVSAVCFVPPSAKFPSGLIISGSNDKTIAVFEPKASKPRTLLKSHTNTVCKIVNGIVSGTILSASWDQTSKLWNLETNQVITTFSGHQAAVWSAIQLNSSLVVTASADKLIKVFDKSGACLRTLTGHTDCVRDVVAISDNDFLTCSNDATVRSWNAQTGHCLATYQGHTNFIYCLSSIIENTKCVGFLSSSEDRTVRLWGLGGDEIQSLSIPAHSVWCVNSLHNGDIVIGSSDGIIRIFSAEPSRQAEQDILSAYEEQVKNMNTSANSHIGDVKVSDLPGAEGLITPGKSDGQTKLIRDGDKVVAYSWSAAQEQWNVVGDVMGSAGSNEVTRPTFNGVEYDFVFNVDIEEGKPPLKLPYNKDEDPWFAAQRFLHQYNLNQQFLEQVANFIITNSGQQGAQSSGPADYVDPFTGGARYIPQGRERESNGVRGSNTDPFTGGSSYNTNTLNSSTSKYFPQRELLRFDQANHAMILEKLLEFNKRVETCEDNDLEDLIQVCELDTPCNEDNISTLKKVMQWPVDMMFPVLDVLRLAVRNPKSNSLLCKDELLHVLKRFIQPPATSPNNMLAVRVLCNMMCEDAGFKLAENQRMNIINIFSQLSSPFTKPLQVALATLLLNLAVVIRRSETSEGRLEALDVAEALPAAVKEEEALFRWLVAVGTLLNDISNTDRLKYAERYRNLILKIHGSYSSNRIQECALHVINILP